MNFVTVVMVGEVTAVQSKTFPSREARARYTSCCCRPTRATPPMRSIDKQGRNVATDALSRANRNGKSHTYPTGCNHPTSLRPADPPPRNRFPKVVETVVHPASVLLHLTRDDRTSVGGAQGLESASRFRKCFFVRTPTMKCDGVDSKVSERSPKRCARWCDGPHNHSDRRPGCCDVPQQATARW